MPVKVFISTPVLFLKNCAQPKRIFANDKGNWQGRLISAWGPVFPQSDASCHISFSSAASAGKVRIMEGQLVSMINELRQGRWISPSIPIIRDRTTTNLLLRNYWKSNSRSFAAGTPRHWCPFDQTVTGLQLDNADATRQLLQTVGGA